MKYYLKKFLACLSLGKKIYIGLPNGSQFQAFADTAANRSVIEQLTKQGWPVAEAKQNRLVQKLLKVGYLTTKKLSKKTNRNYLYLDYLSQLSGDDSLSVTPFLHKKILVIGCGAGGSMMMYQLAQFGFRNITIIDKDTVSESDLGRVAIWRKADIGRPKVEVMQEILAQHFGCRISSEAKFISGQSLRETATQLRPDFIIKAADPDMIFSLELDAVAHELGIPFISLAYSYDLLKIGPLIVPGKTVSEHDIMRINETQYGKGESHYHSKKLFRNYFTHPSVNFNINALAGLAFKEVLFFLIEQYELVETMGKLIIFSPVTFENMVYDYGELKMKNEE
jgi:ThiF family